MNRRRGAAGAACALLALPAGAGWVAAEEYQGAARLTAAQSVSAVGQDGGLATAQSGSASRQDGGLAAGHWVAREQLTAAEAAALPAHCGGLYRLPALPHPRSTDSGALPVEAEADRLEYRLEGDIAVLEGDARVAQGNRLLRAPRVELNRGERRASLSGGVFLRVPGLAMQGAAAEVDLDDGAAILSDAQFLLPGPELRGAADSVARDEAGNLKLTRHIFTRCEPGNDSWQVSARTLDLPKDEVFGTARQAVLRVRGVPVFYAPYIKFPVSDDRQSGFLFPNLGYSAEDGFDLAAPYYLNLAPNYDATLTPRWVSRRGAGLEAEFRRLSRWEQTAFSAAFLPGDDLYNGELDRRQWERQRAAGAPVPPTFDPANRWLAGIDHRGRLGRLSTRVDYAAASDRDYLRDLGTELGISRRIALGRLAELRYQAGGLSMRLWAQGFQRLDEIQRAEYQRLPELDIGYRGGFGPLEYSLAAKAASFRRNAEGLTGIDALSGERLHLEPRLALPLRRPYGFLIASAGYRRTEYRLESEAQQEASRHSRGIGTAALEGGLIFERDLRWFDIPLAQTLEPRFHYLYQGFENQAGLPLFDTKELTPSYRQLFRGDRFSGLDRLGDANRLALGLTTRFLNRRSGREYLRASLGQTLHFQDRRVWLRGDPPPDLQRGSSALAGELAARFAGRWQLTGTLVWDRQDGQIDEAAGSLQYRPGGRRVLNLGYRKRSVQEIDQTDVSLYWPIARRFAVLGRWNFDLVSGRTIEGMAGIEYNDCCWRLRLLARHFLDEPAAQRLADVDADQGIFLQIVFKGLAGFGGRMESVLERSIRGYQPWQ